ncbi:MAG: hypothetical protein KDE56_15130, partial [Anaerolineales bacterium]|nr:hypothetical protein [Anaerolineales bacterium]
RCAPLLVALSERDILQGSAGIVTPANLAIQISAKYAARFDACHDWRPVCPLPQVPGLVTRLTVFLLPFLFSREEFLNLTILFMP